MPKPSDTPRNKKKLEIDSKGLEAQPFSYTEIEELSLRDVIQQAADIGGAIMFGKTRDGGAGTMRFYHDDVNTKTQYFSDPLEFDDEMAKLDALLRRIRES